MATKFSTVQCMKFYEFGSKFLLDKRRIRQAVGEILSEHYAEVHIQEEQSNTNGFTSTYLNLTVAAALVGQLVKVN